MSQVVLSRQVREAARLLHQVTLPILQERFVHVPFTVIESEEPFPLALRLIVSSHCEQRCQYPEEGVLWCHNEGIMRDAIRAPSIQSLVEIARLFLERYGIKRVKIGGLEPVLGPRIVQMIGGLRDVGVEDISFTTHACGVNGQIAALKEAGLTRLTISIQHFEEEGYRRLTGRDGLQSALDLVDEAHVLGLAPLKINRVLLRTYTADIPAFITWVRASDVQVRLFDLMWQPGHDGLYAKYLICWYDLLPVWEAHVERVVAIRYSTSWRTRVVFHLQGGGAIEVNLLQPKGMGNAVVCQQCGLADVCAEGYLGCGVRVTPDLKLSPCILRSDLALDLVPALQAQDEGRLAELDQTLRGSPQVTSKQIRLFACNEAMPSLKPRSRTQGGTPNASD